MQALLNAIRSTFVGNGTLTTAFPSWTNASGGTVYALYKDEAPEGAPLPYVLVAVAEAPVMFVYGGVTHTPVQVEFLAVGVGHDVTLAKAESLALAYRDAPLTLSAGQNYYAQQLSQPIPEFLGRSTDPADSAVQGDVWQFSITFTYAVRQ